MDGAELGVGVALGDGDAAGDEVAEGVGDACDVLVCGAGLVVRVTGRGNAALGDAIGDLVGWGADVVLVAAEANGDDEPACGAGAFALTG